MDECTFGLLVSIWMIVAAIYTQSLKPLYGVMVDNNFHPKPNIQNLTDKTVQHNLLARLSMIRTNILSAPPMLPGSLFYCLGTNCNQLLFLLCMAGGIGIYALLCSIDKTIEKACKVVNCD